MVYLILHNIRSVHNVGSIFRTADAAGVSRIYLTGYTPAPVDRFGRERKDFAKVSLGAEKSVPWEQRKGSATLISELQKQKVTVVALEQSPRSTHYKKERATGPVAVVLGNEVDGIPENVLALCDSIAEIPMHGEKESLNVSVAAGIFLFSLLDS
ncbi:MAG: tRNA/rRNA methyltransferase (SpoU) [Parcubacteria group bacterium GW2011_GWA2_49_9]|nr:MAG: tRNA/rRNA methyltransferase (SpoU) [Parcubacteria group bacterium GW2011_GWA2_49_9]